MPVYCSQLPFTAMGDYGHPKKTKLSLRHPIKIYFKDGYLTDFVIYWLLVSAVHQMFF